MFDCKFKERALIFIVLFPSICFGLRALIYGISANLFDFAIVAAVCFVIVGPSLRLFRGGDVVLPVYYVVIKGDASKSSKVLAFISLVAPLYIICIVCFIW